MRRLSASALLCPLLCLLLCPSDAQRVATPHEVQPGPRDVVHAVWPFGPSYSGKLGGGWPGFSSAGESGDTSSQCNTWFGGESAGRGGDGTITKWGFRW